MAHRDSTGEGGLIGPGDVQWMTAGSGILHEEFHSPAFTAAGGPLEMVQLWVNLPARHKMTTPGYQAITAAAIPDVALPLEAGSVRVIAGEYRGKKGPARTCSPVQVWDMRLKSGRFANLPLHEGWGTGIVVLRGAVQVNSDAIVREGEMAVLGLEGAGVLLEASGDAMVLLLSGEPLGEPIVGHGPFVMNTEAEIESAIADFSNGRFGLMPA